MSDLPTLAFLALRNHFFDETGKPIPFNLRDKSQTQDDPLDEMMASIVLSQIPGVSCIKSSGSLTSPDLALYREERCQKLGPEELAEDLEALLTIEVKKIRREKSGSVARASGADYNSTPPCGRILVYDKNGASLTVRCFYLFVCQEETNTPGQFILSALTLADGDVLNSDQDLYLSIVGTRSKDISLGTYGDGANRKRPMMIFANPLGSQKIDRRQTMIHPSKTIRNKELTLVHQLVRTTTSGEKALFYVYQDKRDVIPSEVGSTLSDPFPAPKRDKATRKRGKFLLPFTVL